MSVLRRPVEPAITSRTERRRGAPVPPESPAKGQVQRHIRKSGRLVGTSHTLFGAFDRPYGSKNSALRSGREHREICNETCLLYRRYSGEYAARGTRTAESHAGDRFPQRRSPGRGWTASRRVPSRAERNRLHRGTKRHHRISLGGGE